MVVTKKSFPTLPELIGVMVPLAAAELARGAITTNGQRWFRIEGDAVTKAGGWPRSWWQSFKEMLDKDRRATSSAFSSRLSERVILDDASSRFAWFTIIEPSKTFAASGFLAVSEHGAGPDSVFALSGHGRTSLEAVENSLSSVPALGASGRLLLGAIDEVLAEMLPIYFGSPAMSLEDWNDVLWTLVRAASRARGVRAPKDLPEAWLPEREASQ